MRNTTQRYYNFIIAIAMIALVSADKNFLSDYHKNMEIAQAEFDKQYQTQLELQRQAQDLSAAGAGANSEAVVNTINGLTEAAKFWGSFVGNEVFDKEALNAKISDLQNKREQLKKYASEDGTAAMVALNQAIWDINVCIKSIQSLAIQLKKGAKNVKMITAVAFKKNQDMLEDREKSIYEAAIKVLVNTLKSGNNNAAIIQEKLYTLSQQLITIETQMTAVSDRLRKSAEGKSKEFEDWKKDMRAKVYGGCTASILLGPVGVATCYSVGAGVLESEIKNYKREVERFKAEFNDWAATFTSLSTMANQASTVSKAWYSKITDFKNVIQNQYDFITGTQDILWMSHDMRQMISDSLTELIEECETVINDTTGRLDEDETAAQDLIVAGAEPQQYVDVNSQVKMMCKAANEGNQDGENRCIQETLVKLQTM